jgi:cyclopropane-fatty-acyl-phospholipid synthase
LRASAWRLRVGSRSDADLRLQDYRDIDDGPYDAICSIEMVEAVGREYWPTYFQSVSRACSSPAARACIQSIVIDDALFERYIASTDFIQQYIFPGGCLPCPREFRARRSRGPGGGGRIRLWPDYAETLRRWREAFLARQRQVLQLGFDESFMRIWEFYLAYCEAAFDMGNIDVVQYTLVKAAR